MENWRAKLKNARKTCYQTGNNRKVHYNFSNDEEMVEEFNMETGVVIRRLWRTTNKLSEQDSWRVELGDPEPEEVLEGDLFVIKQSSDQPVVQRRATRRNLEWRISNMPYPIETYSVKVSDKDKDCLVVRTTNKKFYKCLPILELQRLGLEANDSKIKLVHRHNTLIISYEKPQELKDFERIIFDEIKELLPENQEL